jgi:hypothetical protein
MTFPRFLRTVAFCGVFLTFGIWALIHYGTVVPRFGHLTRLKHTTGQIAKGVIISFADLFVVGVAAFALGSLIIFLVRRVARYLGKLYRAFRDWLRPKPVVPWDVNDYVIQRGDNLWEIANRTLGEPERWTEICELNMGRLQYDGGVFRGPGTVNPGWRIRLPERRLPPVPRSPAPGPDDPVLGDGIPLLAKLLGLGPDDLPTRFGGRLLESVEEEPGQTSPDPRPDKEPGESDPADQARGMATVFSPSLAGTGISPKPHPGVEPENPGSDLEDEALVAGTPAGEGTPGEPAGDRASPIGGGLHLLASPEVASPEGQGIGPGTQSPAAGPIDKGSIATPTSQGEEPQERPRLEADSGRMAKRDAMAIVMADGAVFDLGRRIRAEGGDEPVITVVRVTPDGVEVRCAEPLADFELGPWTVLESGRSSAAEIAYLPLAEVTKMAAMGKGKRTASGEPRTTPDLVLLPLGRDQQGLVLAGMRRQRHIGIDCVRPGDLVRAWVGAVRVQHLSGVFGVVLFGVESPTNTDEETDMAPIRSARDVDQAARAIDDWVHGLVDGLARQHVLVVAAHAPSVDEIQRFRAHAPNGLSVIVMGRYDECDLQISKHREVGNSGFVLGHDGGTVMTFEIRLLGPFEAVGFPEIPVGNLRKMLAYAATRGVGKIANEEVPFNTGNRRKYSRRVGDFKKFFGVAPDGKAFFNLNNRASGYLYINECLVSDVTEYLRLAKGTTAEVDLALALIRGQFFTGIDETDFWRDDAWPAREGLLAELEMATRDMVKRRVRKIMDGEAIGYHKAMWVLGQAQLAYPGDEQFIYDELDYAKTLGTDEVARVWTKVLQTFGTSIPAEIALLGREYGLLE